jgi:acyl-CoA synthetase (NDP forming)
MNARLKEQAGSGAGLDGLLRARSIALVCASERSAWSSGAFANFGQLGFDGRLHAVNPKGGRIHGLSAATSCRAIGQQVDAALLMVPAHAIAEAFDDMRAAGVCNAVILTSGFAEMSTDGKQHQAELAALARQHHINLLGPNCLGFINYVDRVPLWTINLPTRLAGNVALVSQSGATASHIAEFAGRQGVGLSYLVSTGNEADLNIARVLDYLVDDPATQVICLFLETTRDTATLALAAQRALAMGKPIIALKIGSSAVTAKVAQAHTGSLVGDDRVFDAACRQLGIIRVASVDDMVATAGLLARLRPRARSRLGALAISGGICESTADRADALGLELAELAPATQAALRQVMPSFGTPHNPLDITGAAILEPALFAHSSRALGADPGIDLLTCLYDVPTTAHHAFGEQVVAQIGLAFSSIDTPAVLLSVTPQQMTEHTRRLIDTHKLNYLPAGLDRGLAAVARSQWWAVQRDLAATNGRSPQQPQPQPVASSPPLPLLLQSERQVLDFLASRGVPVVPAHIATDAAQADSFAHRFNGPLAMKIASPDIAHKSDVGGVRLQVSANDAGRVYRQIRADVASHCPDARIDGVIVSPMREHGVELLVGIVRDPQWGLVLAVGLGGIWVELLKDTSLRLLPVTPDQVLTMLGELRATRLLDGYRGGPRIDRQQLAQVIARIGDAAFALGPELASLEINPLLATATRIEALDGLVLWNEVARP